MASPLVDGNLGATLIKVGDAIPTGSRFETIVTLTNDHNDKGIPVPGASFLLTNDQIDALNANGHLNFAIPSGYDGLSFVTVDLSTGKRVTLSPTLYAESTPSAQSDALVANLNALEPIKDAQGNIDNTIVASPLVDGNLGATLIKVGDAIPTGSRFETIVTLTNNHNAQGSPVPGASFLLTHAQIDALNANGHLNFAIPSGYAGLSFVTVDLDSGQRVTLTSTLYADSTVNAQSWMRWSRT